MMEERKRKFEVKINRNYNPPKRGIFIDGKLFDWEVDQESLQKAREMGPKFYVMAQLDIEKHFLESLSEFLGREITQAEVTQATQTGFI